MITFGGILEFDGNYTILDIDNEQEENLILTLEAVYAKNIQAGQKLKAFYSRERANVNNKVSLKPNPKKVLWFKINGQMSGVILEQATIVDIDEYDQSKMNLKKPNHMVWSGLIN